MLLLKIYGIRYIINFFTLHGQDITPILIRAWDIFFLPLSCPSSLAGKKFPRFPLSAGKSPKYKEYL
jgi:hypothetical protein